MLATHREAQQHRVAGAQHEVLQQGHRPALRVDALLHDQQVDRHPQDQQAFDPAEPAGECTVVRRLEILAAMLTIVVERKWDEESSDYDQARY
jgi:hypothetical protein